MHSCSYIFFLACADNSCQLGGYFIPSNGYQCYQKDSNNVICTCDNGVEENIPCRMKIK
jgi:hypothetical protein